MKVLVGWLRDVLVFPDPRKPVMMVIGIGDILEQTNLGSLYSLKISNVEQKHTSSGTLRCTCWTPTLFFRARDQGQERGAPMTYLASYSSHYASKVKGGYSGATTIKPEHEAVSTIQCKASKKVQDL